MIELTDLSPMPFGKDDRRCPVADYIRRNLSALQQ